MPFLFFGDAHREAALTHLLLLSAETGKEKRAVAATAGYEGAKVAREALWGLPALPSRDAGLMRLFRDAAMRAIAAEDVSIGGEYVTFSDTSGTESLRLLDEARRSLDAVKARIARESPRFAVWMGIINPNPAESSRRLPAAAALVHYVLNSEGACALVMTSMGVSIVRLPEGYEDISAALARLEEAAGSLRIGTAGEIPLDFTEASTSFTSMLVSPILHELAGITTIGISPAGISPAGISPGGTLRSLPIQALGRYNDEGRFGFLGEGYALFGTSWLSPSTAGFSPAGDNAAGPDILVVGEIDLPGTEVTDDAAEPAASDGTDGVQSRSPDDGGTARIAHCTPDFPWWDSQGRLIVFPETGVWGESDFSRIEYLSYLSAQPVMVIPGEVGPDEVSAFLRETIAASSGRAILFGYADAVRISAMDSRSGGPTGWIRFNLISDFVSASK